MKYLKLIIILLFAFIISCSEGSDSGDKAKDLTKGVDQVYFPSGYVEDGPCLSGGNVSIQMLYPEDLRQTSEAYTTTTESNFGYYDTSRVMRATSYQYAMITVTAACHNEVTNLIMENKTFRAIVDLTEQGNVNINPLTTIITDRQLELFQDSVGLYYQDFEGATIQAETELLENVFNIYNVTDRFKDMALNNRNGGPLLAANAILLDGKTVPEQNALVNDISVALRDDNITQAILDEVSRASQALNMITIKSNLEGRYLEIGLTMSTPDFWNYLDSSGTGVLNKDTTEDSVLVALDFLERAPGKVFDLNMDVAKGFCWGNTTPVYMAYPLVFGEDITANYIGIDTNFLDSYENVKLSIYNDNTDEPGSVLKTIDQINPNDAMVYFGESDFSSNAFRGYLNNYTFNNSVKYWVVVHNTRAGYKYGSGCHTGESSDYGPRMYSVDGITWQTINENQVRMYLLD